MNTTTTNGLNVTAHPYPHYYLTAADFAGNEGVPAALTVPTAVGETAGRYILSLTSYRNPFNPATTIGFAGPAPGHVTIGIYDARGARITTLLDEQRLSGVYTVAWNGRDDSGAAVASGAYVVRIEHAGAVRNCRSHSWKSQSCHSAAYASEVWASALKGLISNAWARGRAWITT